MGIQQDILFLLLDSSDKNFAVVDSNEIIYINKKLNKKLFPEFDAENKILLENTFPEFQIDGTKSKEKAKQIFKSILRDVKKRYLWRIKISETKQEDVQLKINYHRIHGKKYFLIELFSLSSKKNTELNKIKIKSSYNYFIDFFPEPVLIHQNGIVKAANSKAVKALNAKSKNDIININLYNIILPEYLKKAKERMALLNKGESLPYMDYGITDLKGNFKELQVKAVPLVEMKENEVMMFLKEKNHTNSPPSHGQDSTGFNDIQDIVIDKLNTESKLTLSQNLLNAIYNSSLDVILATNENSEIIEYNKAAEKVYGYKREDVLGKNVEFIYASKNERLQVLNALEIKGYFNGELLHKKITGEEFYIYFTIHEIYNSNNRRIGKLGIGRDVTKEKLSNIRIMESEQRFREIFESTSDLIFNINERGDFNYVNNSWLITLGYNNQELSKLVLLDIVHPKDHQKIKILLNDAAERGSLNDEEVTLVKKDKRSVIISLSIYHKNKNNKSNFICNGRNISEQKVTEEKMKLSEARNNAVFNQEFLGIVILDLLGNIQQCNDIFCRYSGFSLQELQMKNINELMTTEYSDHHNFVIRSFLNKKLTKSTFETILLSKSGSKVYGNESWTMVLDADKQPDYFIVFFENITEKKNNEAQIAEQSAKFNSIFESSNQAIFTINRNFELTSFNEFFTKVFYQAFGKMPLLKINLKEFAANYTKNVVIDELILYHQTALSGRPQQFEKKLLIKSKPDLWLDVYIDPIVVPGKPIEEASYIIHDVTDKKISEENIKHSLVEKEILLKEVHHRVKNNLQVISSILNLQTHYIKDNGVLDILQEIQNRIKSMSLVHENLYQNKTLSMLNFGDYITNLTQNLLYSYKAKNKNINIDLKIENINLNLDYSIPCGLILNELVSNCFKHAFSEKDEGNISILFKRLEDEIYMEVTDDGKGMDSEIDFRNTESLGLQLVTALVDQIDGSIEQTSNKNKGTTYKIYFKYKQ